MTPIKSDSERFWNIVLSAGLSVENADQLQNVSLIQEITKNITITLMELPTSVTFAKTTGVFCIRSLVCQGYTQRRLRAHTLILRFSLHISVFCEISSVPVYLSENEFT